MTAKEIFEQIQLKRSFLCVGLDTDIKKTPECLKDSKDPIFEFNKAIIEATAAYTVAYKPNLAFYEENGAEGMVSFEKTCKYIKDNYPEILIIADAKRGDIGNTAQMYARGFYDTGAVDAVTLSPYMGRDAIDPFLKYEGKWSVILALTSNPSAVDFETLELADGKKLYEKVLETSQSWGTTDNIMYVVGATKAAMLTDIRSIVPNHFLLVPGVGAQGGSLEEVASAGMNDECGLLVNSSRGIIYADSSENFAKAAEKEAETLRNEMDKLLKAKGL
ncbi:MAG: orotidine-5'-phosphate decarboxylase [Rikenellaceae bacterium]